MQCIPTAWIASRVSQAFRESEVLVSALTALLTVVCLNSKLRCYANVFTGQPNDLADISQTIDTEDTDVEAIDREEINTLTEDMADFLQSIID